MSNLTYNTGGALDGLGYNPKAESEAIERQFIQHVERLAEKYLSELHAPQEAEYTMKDFIGWLKDLAKVK